VKLLLEFDVSIDGQPAPDEAIGRRLATVLNTQADEGWRLYGPQDVAIREVRYIKGDK